MTELEKLVKDYIESTNTKMEIVNELIADIKKDQKTIIENFNKLFNQDKY